MDESEWRRQLVPCDLCGADDAVRVLEKGGAFYVQCRRCQFVYANPRVFVPVAEIEQEYESKKEHYAATR